MQEVFNLHLELGEGSMLLGRQLASCRPECLPSLVVCYRPKNLLRRVFAFGYGQLENHDQCVERVCDFAAVNVAFGSRWHMDHCCADNVSKVAGCDSVGSASLLESL